MHVIIALVILSCLPDRQVRRKPVLNLEDQADQTTPRVKINE